MSELNIKLGTLLKTERKRQKIDIDDLAERLKITVAYLEAIEAGTTDGLPSDLYFTLFAKSYAEALGIDYTRTIDAIKADIEENGVTANKSKNGEKKQNNQKGDENEDENQFLKKGVIVFGVIVGLFVIFLGVNKIFFSSDTAEISQDNSSDSQVQNKSQQVQEYDEAYKSYDWDNKEFDKPSKIILTLTPRQESWSAIFADGDTAIYRTLRVGRTYTAEADYRLIVSIGVPSAVTIKLNGQEVDLRNKDSRRIFKVLINQMNIDDFLNPDKDSKTAETAQEEVTQVTKAVPSIVTTEDSVSNENSETN